MRLTGPGTFLVSLLFVMGCERSTSLDDDQAPRSPAFDSTFHARILAALHPAAMRSDTIFCDSILKVYDDTALARMHPGRVNDAFVYAIISHDGYPTASMERFYRLARYADSDRMLAWHDFLIARWRMMNGDHVEAVRLYQNLLTRFERVQDGAGISSACRRLGQIYRLLGDFEVALPYLHRALPGEPRAEFRCNMLYAMGECHAHAHRADSVRWCRDRIAEMAGDSMLLQRGDDRVRLYTMRLGLDAATIEARRTGRGDAMALVRDMARLDSLLEHRDPWLGFIEAHDAASHIELAEEVVRALTALNRTDLARTLVLEAEERARDCTDCTLEEVALYAAVADMHIALGDRSEALRYQTLRADALTRNEVGKARLAVEQARQREEFQQQQSGMAQALEQERQQARAMDIEYRMQRINLVVMIGFVILFAGMLFVQLRTRRRMQLEEVRTRLSRDLHDDIGSTLSSINILTSVARKKAEAGDVVGAAASLTGISERSQRLQRNMSDIVWSVDPDRDSLEELLVRMREFGASVLEPKEITYRFDAQGDHNTALPPMVKSNLYLIFKEAVNNAAKHAQATAVSVDISYRNNRLKMTIVDNGRGLPDTNGTSRAHGGNGLRNMRKRAEEMNADLRIASTPQQGTTVDLTIPL